MPAPDDMPGWLPAAEKSDRHHVGDAEAAEREGGDRQRTATATVRPPACPAAAIRPTPARSSPRRSGCARRRRGSASAPSRRRKPAKAKPAVAMSAPSSWLQIERRPVEHRAFRDHREQRHQADQIDSRVRAAARSCGAPAAGGLSSATRWRKARAAMATSDARSRHAACAADGRNSGSRCRRARRRQSRRGSRNRARTT